MEKTAKLFTAKLFKVISLLFTKFAIITTEYDKHYQKLKAELRESERDSPSFGIF